MKRNGPTIAVVLLLAGCSGSAHSPSQFELIDPPYEAAFQETDYVGVRITVADSVVEWGDPRIQGDSIWGEWQPYYERALALEDVLEIRGIPAAPPGVAIPLGMVAALAVGVLAVVASQAAYP